MTGRLKATTLRAVERATALAQLAASPGGIHAMRQVRPFSIAAFRLVEGIAAEGISFSTVIDVGANRGQFSRAALARWPEAAVLAFEPLPEVAHQLRNALAGFPLAEVHVVALGDEDGTVSFHPHTYTLSSSALPVVPEARGQYSWAEERPAVEVALCRLDSVLGSRHLVGPVLLKLDVQGYELKVLGGAVAVLARVDALVIEQSFERFYEGQPLFSEANRFLEALGWHLARPLDWRLEKGRIVEIDCLYLRHQ